MLEKLKEGLKKFVDSITKTRLTPEKLESVFWELEIALTECDVAMEVIQDIEHEISEALREEKVSRFASRKEVVLSALRDVLLRTFREAGALDLEEAIKSKKEKPFVILFLGVNGVGKTTTIAKIAKWLMKRGYSVVLACSDTFRAGAIEQLAEHAKRLGVRMISRPYGADPASVAYDAIQHAKARGIDVVLIDTAGRMQTKRNLMEEMRKIARVCEPDLVLFVGDALTGNDAVEQAKEFHKWVGIDGVVLAKMDADAKGGAAISIVKAIKKPILFLGTGQSYEDLEEFKAEAFLDRILPA